MQLFLDSASLSEIKEATTWGVIDGVTTNPTLVAREGEGNFPRLLADICSFVRGPVSAEVMATETAAMVQEARELAAIAPQIVIKIPMTPDGLKSVVELQALGIRTNVTLVFSFNQALLAAKAGADYISPFLGRLDDLGADGVALVTEICTIFCTHGLESRIIAASIRHPLHVVQVARAGAHVATVPFTVLRQMVAHPLTDLGLARFQADWRGLLAKKA
ncbi:MAG: fructose-6-phosphate aldolase [Dethiobacter sp.]|nr:fructose-6-phosphate aldolase [Dethiobacter sp.]MCL5981869.1 fructose-6-phosphate aldolase [Bacillota bacterium]